MAAIHLPLDENLFMQYHICMIKKIGLLIFVLMFSILLPCDAKVLTNGASDKEVPKVFIYHLPEDIVKSEINTLSKGDKPVEVQQETEVKQDIVSDDVTADTSGEEIEEEEEISEENSEPDVEEYQIGDMYADVLHGYAQYDEGEENAIFLTDTLSEFQAIKLAKPARVGTKKYAALPQSSPGLYSSLSTVEYSIAPVSGSSFAKKGGFSAGTIYSQGIDYAELEQSTGVFSRYESKYFAISTAYAKTVNSTNNNYNDNFYVAPELILNQYFSLKEVLSADIAKNRKKAEFILSINPFGKKDIDRLRFELGTSATYDDTNALLKNQFKFSTKFKL